MAQSHYTSNMVAEPGQGDDATVSMETATATTETVDGDLIQQVAKDVQDIKGMIEIVLQRDRRSKFVHDLEVSQSDRKLENICAETVERRWRRRTWPRATSSAG